MDRREFLSGSVLAATAGLALDACAPDGYGIIPVLIPEEPFIPGQESWLPSTCFECEAGCGIRVRKIDGRLVKVEGDPQDLSSLGGVCARGQALPQAMYHPDRIQSPLAREQSGWVKLSWDEAVDRVAAELAKARDSGIAPWCGFLTGSARGKRLAIAKRFLEAMGGGRLLRHRPFDSSSIAEAHRLATGQASLFDFDLSRASYAISFGAEILEGDRSPVRFARALAEMRQGRAGRRGKFVMAGPRLSLTAANADEWIPVRPGHDLDLALAISSILIERGLHDSAFASSGATDFARFQELLAASARPAEVAERIGVPLSRIERIAGELAAHRPVVALAGYKREDSPRATALALAVSHLNALLGAYEGEGLLRAPRIEAETDSRSLVDEIRSGNALPRVLFVDDANPMHSVPGLEEALSGSFLVSFASFPDETMERADIVLPESMSFERFEAASPELGDYERISGPLLLRPLYDTRSMPDALIALARKMDRSDAVPWESYEQALREEWAPAGSWDDVLAKGGRERPAAAPVSFATSDQRYGFATEPLEAALAEPIEAGRTLHVYSSTAFGDGRSARLPYLQDLADPVTGIRWGSLVEIAETDAAELGVRTGDSVEIQAGETRLTAPAHVSQGIVPGVVALAAGQGHTANGRHASGRGINAYALREGAVELRRAERARPGGSGRAEGAEPRESGRSPRARSEGSEPSEERGEQLRKVNS